MMIETGSAGGLHLIVAPPQALPDGRLVNAAAGLGSLVLGLSTMTRQRSAEHGLVLSYARATPDMCEEAVHRLARASEGLDQIPPDQPNRGSETAIASPGYPWQDVG